ncbi:hypothetical protein LOTGIDRAFT_139782, partial [Lottia gigantea]
DRLNHIWAVFIFSIFALIVVLEQFVGDPIHCWCPAEFTDSHCNYTEAYCWIEDTYYIPNDQAVPWEESARRQDEVKYYPWVPLILVFLAGCFKLPNLIWDMLNGVTGVNISKVIETVEESTMAADRRLKIEFVANYLDKWLFHSRKLSYGTLYKLFESLSSFMCFCFGQGTVSFITGLYILIKFCYLCVAVTLLFLLNKVLAMNYTIYGWEVLDNLINGEELVESSRFPRVTLCDFQIRQLQNIQTYSVQCLLSVNLFNEKIFIFTWFWLVALSILNLFAWLSALNAFSLPCSRRKWIRTHMDAMRRKSHDEVKEQFIMFLGIDGIFLLRLIEDNSSEITIADIILELWRLFNKRGRISSTPDVGQYIQTLRFHHE